MKAHVWTIEQLGKRKYGGYFAYPSTLEGVAVCVRSQDAADVVTVANAIERLGQRNMALNSIMRKTAASR